MSHTPEPWHSGCRQIEDDNGVLIANLTGWKGDAESKANARRIVACVNACKGIKTESLEMEVLSWITDETGENPLQRERDELLEARRACGERLIEVLKERDELLAGKLVEEPLRRQLDELRDEVEYHRTDAKKWALQALKFNKSEPVAIVDDAGTIIVCSYRYKPGDKLFTHPAPVPAEQQLIELVRLQHQVITCISGTTAPILTQQMRQQALDEFNKWEGK
jgi:hypothetical protein